MSWDVLLIRLPEEWTAIEDVPDDFESPPIGKSEEVRDAVASVVPEVDFSDPAWGMLDGPTFSIEVNTGREEPTNSVMLHVRGGNESLGAVHAISKALGCAAIDCSDGVIIDWTAEDAGYGLAAWRQYRDRVVGVPGDGT